ncbi:tRNA(Ile)-lysidine synthase [Flavobacterium glycines]|uniref:tRNA(Ile)-lysidine synthase n=1 Tax=Flavobacterium glycines TaxID=551990 RepID=A0A1B9DZ15_9FLAO|nr:tRNA lysidine(34) synthetase TilS [Flavobacterium glycines]OCB74920.1 tRNA(Ile)-lysidine synthetase [Flavobacterium glycines]GEL11201.1 tRNA(Ile)-lysidine synthase [Flavobacterium glycines]SDJ46733.1 tRNA(Ile)-lysidine synthase [Flavobacterium glycines]
MLDKLKENLNQNFPFLENAKLLLATSGGIDSMVLVHLLHELNYDIAMCHCNFQLRGLESFGDQKFIQDYAEANEIPLFLTQFDTEAFAKDYKLSIQIAARELRYNWFYELLETESYDYIITAHHADDVIETFIINLSRGTGLDGLVGIPEQNDKIIRPLLPFSREEIQEYAAQNHIQWREDSSNASDKYLRNKIRHHIVPLLKELNPHFLESFEKTCSYLKESQELVEDAAVMVYQQVAQEEGETIRIDLKQLLRLPNYKSYLYQWLKEFGFTAWEDIYDLVESQSGKQVFSSDYRLLKDRMQLILSPIQEGDETVYLIEKDTQEIENPLMLVFSRVNEISKASHTTIFVDEDKLTFPLVLKRWEEGDSFQPFGMNGKTKKLSKLFKDEKLSLIEKENTWVLWSANEIVWVVGIRQDERFKIDDSTKKILKIDLES